MYKQQQLQPQDAIEFTYNNGLVSALRIEAIDGILQYASKIHLPFLIDIDWHNLAFVAHDVKRKCFTLYMLELSHVDNDIAEVSQVLDCGNYTYSVEDETIQARITFCDGSAIVSEDVSHSSVIEAIEHQIKLIAYWQLAGEYDDIFITDYNPIIEPTPDTRYIDVWDVSQLDSEDIIGFSIIEPYVSLYELDQQFDGEYQAISDDNIWSSEYQNNVRPDYGDSTSPYCMIDSLTGAEFTTEVYS